MMPCIEMPGAQTPKLKRARVSNLRWLSPYSAFTHPREKMINYTTTVPTNPNGHSLPIKRTPAFGALTAIITTENLIGCYTHYWHGRTIPCTLPDCPAHEDGAPFRWHAYQGAWETKTALHFIFEVTACGAEPFITYRDSHNTLRGCLFQAKRFKERPNGRILIHTKPAVLTEINLPNPPDLPKCLATLWSLNPPMANSKKRNPSKRTNTVPIGDDATQWTPAAEPDGNGEQA